MLAVTLSLFPPLVSARRTQGRRGTTESRAHCPTNGFWGNSLIAKPTTSFRIGFQNINGFNLDSSDEKSQKIQTITTLHHFDFLGIQEVNLHLRIMGTDGLWAERHHSTFTGYTHASTTTHCSSRSRRVFGGTACFMTPNTAHRAMEHGQDLSNLGRWSWTLMRGRNNLHTRIITGYRPVRSYNDEALTVYAQQELYFRQHGGWRDPRLAFFEDLDVLIQQCLVTGEQIILGMDLNEDIRTADIQSWLLKWQLIEPLSRLHGTIDIATCGSNSAQTPIDTIWSSPGLVFTIGGMTGFGELDLGSADHRCLWVDVTHDSLYGMRPPPPMKRPTNSFPLNDPRVITKYNNFVLRERSRIGLGPKILELKRKAQLSTFSNADAQQYEHLLVIDLSIRNRAKLRCRPFYSGQVMYSDTIGNDRKEIHLWNMVISRRVGKRSDTRAIRRLMKSTNQPLALQLTLEQAKSAQAACQERYQVIRQTTWLFMKTSENPFVLVGRKNSTRRLRYKRRSSSTTRNRAMHSGKSIGSLEPKLARLSPR